MAGDGAGLDTQFFSVSTDEVAQYVRALNKLSKDTQSELRDWSFSVANQEAPELRMAILGSPAPQGRLVAETVKPSRDRLPVLKVGGSKQVGRKYRPSQNGKRVTAGRRRGAAAGELMWGTEYGGHSGVDSAGRRYTNRFKARENKRGYWLLDFQNEAMQQIWNDWKYKTDLLLKKDGVI